MKRVRDKKREFLITLTHREEEASNDRIMNDLGYAITTVNNRNRKIDIEFAVPLF